MVDFKEFKLSNGLQVIVHPDHSSPIVCLNILYKVGSRNEDPDKTGFAHLFEHLMFGGSANVESFDEPLQAVGGDNNAFTSTDITNYYTIVPSPNAETAFWLESDRMMSLSFKPEVLETQRNVVIEEFKQRYLNQPYGDVWLKLSPVAYEVHPYRWPTIGKDISHIENATMADVRKFFKQYYEPTNAILVVSGDLSPEKALKLSEKWFGPIESGSYETSPIPQEPEQTSPRFSRVESRVPQDAIYKVYHMPGRTGDNYHTVDLLGDILGRGKSSILYQGLVKEKQLLSHLSVYVTGSCDPGLLVISGRLNDKTGFEEVEEELSRGFAAIENISETDVSRVKNLAESSLVFGEVELLNRTMNLAYSAFLGDTDLINQEQDRIRKVTKDRIIEQSLKILDMNNCSTLHYKAL